MTTPPQSRVSLHDPGELIAALPPLLGFRPVDSLVLAVFGDAERDDADGSDDLPADTARARLRLTVRADLPPPELRADLASHLVCPVLGDGPTGSCAVAAIVVGGGTADPGGPLPHRELPALLEETFADVDVPLVHALWVEAVRGGATWRCYDDPACRGTVPDPRSTVVAATAAALGVHTFDSREDMAATIAPDDEDALARRTVLLEQVSVAGAEDAVARGRELLGELIDRQTIEPSSVDDQQVVDLALALSVPEIRDGRLGSAFTERAPVAERLWIELTRRVPVPHRAEPACLLGFSAYVRGDGALAGMALDRAMDAYSGHRLAHLLRCALDSGFPPGEMRAILSELGSDADQDDQCGDEPECRCGPVPTTGTG
jgi:hypothetical protein